MSDHKPESFNGPLRAHRDRPSGVFVKIWANETNEGKTFYTTSVGRTFKDPETGEPRDTNSLTQSQMSKLPPLINEANQTLRMLNDPRISREKALNPDRQTVETDLKAQRDAVMAQVKAPSASNGSSPSHAPDMTA